MDSTSGDTFKLIKITSDMTAEEKAAAIQANKDARANMTPEQKAAERKAAKAAKKAAKAAKKAAKGKQTQGVAKSGAATSTASTSKKSQNIFFDINPHKEFPRWYEEIIKLAEVVDNRYPIKGMSVFMPYGYYMHDRIMRFVEDEWESQDIERALFPTLIPWKFLSLEGDFVKGFEKECFWVTKKGFNEIPNKEDHLALRPTSECPIYDAFSKWLKTSNTLPIKIFQTCTVFRYETKQTIPLIRVREIPWNEVHTCHATVEEAIQNLEDAWKSYLGIMNDRLAVFGCRLRRPDWDRFPGAVHTDVYDTILPSGKVLQSVGAHYLGQKFAKPFDIRWTDHNGDYQFVEMTCYGVSTRLLASTLSIHGDKSGLVLPPDIARYQVVIMPVLFSNKGDIAAQEEKCGELLSILKKGGIRAVQDITPKNPGTKFFFWEMKGVPIRLEVGPKDMAKQQVRLVRRHDRSKMDVKWVDLVETVKKVMIEITTDMRKKAHKFHNEHVQTATTLEELVTKIHAKGGFVKVPFCSIGHDGEEADAIIHEHTGGEIRGWNPFEEQPTDGMKCIATGKPATVYGYVAKAY